METLVFHLAKCWFLLVRAPARCQDPKQGAARRDQLRSGPGSAERWEQEPTPTAPQAGIPHTALPQGHQHPAGTRTSRQLSFQTAKPNFNDSDTAVQLVPLLLLLRQRNSTPAAHITSIYYYFSNASLSTERPFSPPCPSYCFTELHALQCAFALETLLLYKKKLIFHFL